jgi:dolichyl-phosphate beta-glucosyltransferase
MPSTLSVIIPAYNEEARLPAYLDKILTYFEHHCCACEIIVVDDGSVDGTAAVVERYAKHNAKIQLVRLAGNHGKGYAVKAGMLKASGELRLFADADGATPIEELERLLKAHELGADVVVASRALRDDSCRVQEQFLRMVIGNIFNLIVRTVAVGGIADTQCGFKLFTAEAADTVFPLLTISGFAFDVEVLYLCRKNGYLISEVPVNWIDVKGTKVDVVRDSWRMFMDVLKVWRNNYRGMYKHSA